VKPEQLFNLIGTDMKAVDAVIRARLHSDVVLVRQVAEYIVNAGGKRLRPALVLAQRRRVGLSGSTSPRTCGGCRDDPYVDIAA
jgi:octaprenyl-diphosphate synthase